MVPLATILLFLLGGIWMYIGILADTALAGEWPLGFFVLYGALGVMTMLAGTLVGFRWWHVVLAVAFVAALGVYSRMPTTPRKVFAATASSLGGLSRDRAEQRMATYNAIEPAGGSSLTYVWTVTDSRYKEDQMRVWLDDSGKVLRAEFWPVWRVDREREDLLKASEK